MSFDLLLRNAIIFSAFELACAWMQAFQSPWPLADAFKLADTVEEQLLKSLGIKFDLALRKACDLFLNGRKFVLCPSGMPNRRTRLKSQLSESAVVYHGWGTMDNQRRDGRELCC